MSTIKNEKLRFRLPALVPVLAGMLFIFERVLLSATTVPTYGESPISSSLYSFYDNEDYQYAWCKSPLVVVRLSSKIIPKNYSI